MGSFAMPLYLQAISILIPPPPKKAPASDRCRGTLLNVDVVSFAEASPSGAQLMTNLAELIIQTDPEKNPDKLHQAQAWVQKALAIVEDARKSSKEEEPEAGENEVAIRQKTFKGINSKTSQMEYPFMCPFSGVIGAVGTGGDIFVWQQR